MVFLGLLAIGLADLLAADRSSFFVAGIAIAIACCWGTHLLLLFLLLFASGVLLLQSQKLVIVEPFPIVLGWFLRLALRFVLRLAALALHGVEDSQEVYHDDDDDG